MRRLAILAEGSFSITGAKTAVGVIRYGRDPVVAVIDSTAAGKMADEVIGVGHRIPIVASLEQALQFEPDTLLLGIATRGGWLPAEWRAIILSAIEHGLDVVNGLHLMLNEDPELVRAALARGVRLVDVRKPSSDLPVAQGYAHRAGSFTILTVGSDCNVGKMTVALEVHREAARRGIDATFVATGQTGIMIWGSGIAVDRVIGDFMAGSMEQLVVPATRDHDWVVVEGQGCLQHPAYSGVTLALLHGSAPDALILCHQASREKLRGYDLAIRPLDQLGRDYEAAAAWVKPARVVGLALATFDLAEAAAREALRRAEDLTGLPAADCVRFGPGPLVDALAEARQELVGPGAAR